MRRAAPVTSAAFGIGGVGKPPCTLLGLCGVTRGHGVPCPTLAAGAHLGPHHLARRHAGPAQCRAAARPAPTRRGRAIRRQPEIGLFEAADFVAQPRRFLEFEVGSGGAHVFFEIGDDRLQILALIVRRVALAETDRDVILLIDAVENVGDAAPHAFRRDAVRRVVGLLLLPPPVGLVDRCLQAVGHAVSVKDRAALDDAARRGRSSGSARCASADSPPCRRRAPRPARIPGCRAPRAAG